MKAVIFGFEGKELSQEEIKFFQEQDPLGFIIFARNIEDKNQLKKLTASLIEILDRDDVLILIDQEGGRVARLKPPHFRDTLPAGDFAKLAEGDLELAKRAVYLNHRLIADELYELGINVDCAPMIDVLFEGSHDIVGDRAFGKTPEQVATLANEACNGLIDGGVMPVIKHIPGHGRAKADSHEDLPIVDASLEELEKTDFVPFKELNNQPFAMTAHIKYSAIDKENPATLSNKAIDLIRNKIGFGGALMTDDLSMKALSGDFSERVKNSIAAGCDIILHCNGDMNEMVRVASATPELSDDAKKRVENAWKFYQKPKEFDVGASEKELAEIMQESVLLEAEN